jgi:polygalacturonase
MWEIHPVLSHNVTVQGVTVNSHGPNNDGCDPECCRDVVIEGCTFDTGDDCIAIKAGKNADGRRVNVPSEDIVIRNCTFADGHGGVTIGSEMTGGVRNIFAEDLQMSSPNLNNCLRLKTNSLRGGFIENVHMRNTTVGQVSAEAFLIDFFYGPDNGLGGFNPTVADITMSNVTVGAAKEAFYLVGYANDHIQGIALTNCVFSNVLLSPGYTVKYVDDLELRNVVVNGTQLPNATAAQAAVPV